MYKKMIKILLALLLAIQLVAPVMPVIVHADEINDFILEEDNFTSSVMSIAPTSTGITIRPVPARGNNSMGQWIANIATSQVQTGTATGNRNPYSLEVRNRDGHAWCGDFVAWVYRRAGFTNYFHHSYNSSTPRAGTGGWNFSSSQNWRNTNTLFAPVSGNPQPGDFAVWQDGNNWSGHISIVTGVNTANNTVTFVSGNWSSSVRQRTVNNISNPLGQQPSGRVFRGYFRLRSINAEPQPPAPGNFFPRYTGNSTSIINALNALGIDSSFAHRQQIAAANGITNFTGTAAQNTQLLNLLRNGTLRRPAGAASYFPRYTGNSTSIINALNALGIDSSFAHRQQIATANGITNFTGTAAQNTQLLNLLRNGTLRRP